MSFKGCNSCSFYFALIIKEKGDGQQRGLQFNLFADSLELKSVQLTPQWGGGRAEKRLCGLCVSLAAQQLQVLFQGTETDLDTCLHRQKTPNQQHKKQKNASRLEYDSAWHNRSADSGRDPRLLFSSPSQLTNTISRQVSSSQK